MQTEKLTDKLASHSVRRVVMSCFWGFAIVSRCNPPACCLSRLEKLFHPSGYSVVRLFAFVLCAYCWLFSLDCLSLPQKICCHLSGFVFRRCLGMSVWGKGFRLPWCFCQVSLLKRKTLDSFSGGFWTCCVYSIHLLCQTLVVGRLQPPECAVMWSAGLNSLVDLSWSSGSGCCSSLWRGVISHLSATVCTHLWRLLAYLFVWTWGNWSLRLAPSLFGRR